MDRVPGPMPDGEAGEQRPDELGPLRWSIRRAIELLDEGIDRMGEQLTRSAGLWGDSPADPGELAQSRRGRQRARRDPVDEEGLPLESEAYNAPAGPDLP